MSRNHVFLTHLHSPRGGGATLARATVTPVTFHDMEGKVFLLYETYHLNSRRRFFHPSFATLAYARAPVEFF